MVYLNLSLRLAIWFLLTADLSLVNIIIGVTISLLIPLGQPANASLREWGRTLWKSLLAIPQAYIEAVEIMLKPHRYEETQPEKVQPHRTPGLIFLDIFNITFTPKTIVTKYDKRGWYDVHWIRRRKPK